MVLQASTLAETNQEQTKLLDLLEIFRNYTETGRVAREELASSGRRKTYAEATGANTATNTNNTPSLRQSTHAVLPREKQKQNQSVKATAT